MSATIIPPAFIDWAYHQRAELVLRQVGGEALPPHEIFLGFCRHTPAIVSNGPAGLNASIKGVGFLPRDEFLPAVLAAYCAHIERGWDDDYSRQGLQLLVDHLYGQNCADRIDFSRLGSLELACGHTWQNFQENPVVTMLFYQPPRVSFEVRGRVAIHQPGSIFHEFLNAQHDVYHQPDPQKWAKRPAYIFSIEEVYDNSASKTGFGQRLL